MRCRFGGWDARLKNSWVCGVGLFGVLMVALRQAPFDCAQDLRQDLRRGCGLFVISNLIIRRLTKSLFLPMGLRSPPAVMPGRITGL